MSDDEGLFEWWMLGAPIGALVALYGAFAVLVGLEVVESPFLVDPATPRKVADQANSEEDFQASVDEAYNALHDEYRQTVTDIVSAYSCREDRVEQATFCSPSGAPKYTNSKTSIYSYFSIKGDLAGDVDNLQVWPVLQVQRAGSDWVFWEKLVVRAGDRKNVWVPPAPPLRDVGGQVAEWVTVSSPDHILLLATMLSRSDDEPAPLVRFSGTRAEDLELSPWEEASIKAAFTILMTARSRSDVEKDMRKARRR